MSSVNETVCRCSGNTFSTTFYVPPNMINFLTVFNKFDVTNAFVYGPLIGMFVIYIIAAIFLRREDKKDLTRVCDKVLRLSIPKPVKWNKIFFSNLTIDIQITLIFRVYECGLYAALYQTYVSNIFAI